jgi:hypothetical protein
MMSSFFIQGILILSAWGAPIESHQKEIAEIAQKTVKYERRIADLQKRKMQAREGEELEGVLNEIGDVHKELLALRRERGNLKQHLLEEHPESNLVYDANLHKTFNKQKSDVANPLDERLDQLLNLMQTQYAKYLPAKIKEDAAPAPVDVKKVEAPRPVTQIPPATPDVKEKYLQDQIKTEMKVGVPAPPPEEKKKAKFGKKAGEKAEEKPAAEKPTEPAHAAPAAHH